MGCRKNHLWDAARLRQLPSKPSSNQSWVPGLISQNSGDQNVFFLFFLNSVDFGVSHHVIAVGVFFGLIFFGKKGVMLVPFYTRSVSRSFLFSRIFWGEPTRISLGDVNTEHCLKVIHNLPVHFSKWFWNVPDLFLWFFNRFLTGTADVTLKKSQGRKGFFLSSIKKQILVWFWDWPQLDLIVAIYHEHTWHMVSWELVMSFPRGCQFFLFKWSSLSICQGEGAPVRINEKINPPTQS